MTSVILQKYKILFLYLHTWKCKKINMIVESKRDIN